MNTKRERDTAPNDEQQGDNLGGVPKEDELSEADGTKQDSDVAEGEVVEGDVTDEADKDDNDVDVSDGKVDADPA